MNNVLLDVQFAFRRRSKDTKLLKRTSYTWFEIKVIYFGCCL